MHEYEAIQIVRQNFWIMGRSVLLQTFLPASRPEPRPALRVEPNRGNIDRGS